MQSHSGMTYELILSTLCCLTLITAIVESRQPKTAAEEWRIYYDRVFEPTEILADQSKIADYITFLHMNLASVVQIDSVTEHMIANVKYSYNILTDINTSHCNVAHLADLRKRLEQIRPRVDGNLKVLFGLAHRNLIEVCGVLYDRLPKFLERLMERNDSRFVKTTASQYSKNIETNNITNQFKQEVYLILGANMTWRAEEIVNAWNNRGPCKKLRTALQTIGHRSFNEFADLNSYNGPEAAELCQSKIVSWALATYRCHRLDSLILDIAKARHNTGNKFEKF